jgi:hypothetical protein
MRITFLKIIVLILCFNTVYSQGFEPGKKGKALIYFEPTTAIIRLDTTFLKQTKKPISLNIGTYVIRAWAPTKQLFIDTIEIKENKMVIISRHLKNTKEYDEYRRKLSVYKNRKVFTKFLPFPLTLAYSGYTFWAYNNNKAIIKSHLENTQSAITRYQNAISISDIDASKQQYEDEKNSYEKYRRKNNILAKTSAIIIPTALIVSTGLYFLSKKFIKPQYIETKPLLSLNSINIKNEFPSTCSVSISMNINR